MPPVRGASRLIHRPLHSRADRMVSAPQKAKMLPIHQVSRSAASLSLSTVQRRTPQCGVKPNNLQHTSTTPPPLSRDNLSVPTFHTLATKSKNAANLLIRSAQHQSLSKSPLQTQISSPPINAYYHFGYQNRAFTNSAFAQRIVSKQGQNNTLRKNRIEPSNLSQISKSSLVRSTLLTAIAAQTFDLKFQPNRNYFNQDHHMKMRAGSVVSNSVPLSNQRPSGEFAKKFLGRSTALVEIMEKLEDVLNDLERTDEIFPLLITVFRSQELKYDREFEAFLRIARKMNDPNFPLNIPVFLQWVKDVNDVFHQLTRTSQARALILMAVLSPKNPQVESAFLWLMKKTLRVEGATWLHRLFTSFYNHGYYSLISSSFMKMLDDRAFRLGDPDTITLYNYVLEYGFDGTDNTEEIFELWKRMHRYFKPTPETYAAVMNGLSKRTPERNFITQVLRIFDRMNEGNAVSEPALRSFGQILWRHFPSTDIDELWDLLRNFAKRAAIYQKHAQSNASSECLILSGILESAPTINYFLTLIDLLKEQGMVFDKPFQIAILHRCPNGFSPAERPMLMELVRMAYAVGRDDPDVLRACPKPFGVLKDAETLDTIVKEIMMHPESWEPDVARDFLNSLLLVWSRAKELDSDTHFRALEILETWESGQLGFEPNTYTQRIKLRLKNMRPGEFETVLAEGRHRVKISTLFSPPVMNKLSNVELSQHYEEFKTHFCSSPRRMASLFLCLNRLAIDEMFTFFVYNELKVLIASIRERPVFVQPDSMRVLVWSFLKCARSVTDMVMQNAFLRESLPSVNELKAWVFDAFLFFAVRSALDINVYNFGLYFANTKDELAAAMQLLTSQKCIPNLNTLTHCSRIMDPKNRWSNEPSVMQSLNSPSKEHNENAIYFPNYSRHQPKKYTKKPWQHRRF